VNEGGGEIRTWHGWIGFVQHAAANGTAHMIVIYTGGGLESRVCCVDDTIAKAQLVPRHTA
jgi:hypothetical protein